MGVIERYRQKHGLSLAEFAQRVGDVTPTSLSRIDRGEQEPGSRLLKRIFAATDGEITPNDILGIEPPQPAQEAGAAG